MPSPTARYAVKVYMRQPTGLRMLKGSRNGSGVSTFPFTSAGTCPAAVPASNPVHTMARIDLLTMSCSSKKQRVPPLNRAGHFA